MADVRTLAVPDGLSGERVDAALARLLGLSRSRVVALIDTHCVRVDGLEPAKADRLVAGTWLEIDVATARPSDVSGADASSGQSLAAGLVVLHDDDDVIVVDKPVGVAAHASPGWSGPTVVGHLSAAGYRIAASGAAERQGIVHRLDVGTSGVMVVAKSEQAYSVLKQAFRERTVVKNYHALVQGHPDPLTGTIDAPIGRHPKADHRFAVTAEGRPSRTHYETLEAHRHASLLLVHLETGRTHQIRVHMSALHHPCVGDLTYGADPVLAARVHLERQWLHAVGLGFAHPADGSWVSFESAYPDDLSRALDLVREGV